MPSMSPLRGWLPDLSPNGGFAAQVLRAFWDCFPKRLDFFEPTLLYPIMLTELEKKVIASIQKDLPISTRPYLEMAEATGITEDEFLKTLETLCEKGIVRRFGATLRHQQSGFRANAMAAWQVDEARIDKVGQMMAAFSQVSHCYRRNPTGDWPYNLYTMIHATDENACRETALKMAEVSDVDTYTLLFSRRELKKISMEYFSTDEDD